MCLPFRDHLINGIDVRFDKYNKNVLGINNVSTKHILDIKSDDLPSPFQFSNEVIHWNKRWTASEVFILPDTIVKALLKMCRLNEFKFNFSS